MAASRKIRCLIGPELNGWVGIYPEGHGQDEGMGRDIAERVGGFAMHVLVHDDDILAYWLWSDGKLLDRYHSSPGYFGEENLAEEEPLVGDVKQFAFVLDESGQKKLAKLIGREAKPTFEVERLGKLGKVLGIQNVVAAYEYLKDGERDQIKGWRQFEEIPAEAVETLALKKRAERNRVKAERADLKKKGKLLFFNSVKEHTVRVCAKRDGFVFAWANHRNDHLYVEECVYPFNLATPVAIESPGHVTAAVSNEAGTRMAFAAGDRVRVWDATDTGWRQVIDIPEHDLTIGAAMSADGTMIVHQSRQRILITHLLNEKQALSIPLRRDFHLDSCDPSGRWVILGGSDMMLVDLEQAPHERVIYIGGKRGISGSARTHSPVKIDFEKLEKMQKETTDVVINQMQESAAKSKKTVDDG